MPAMKTPGVYIVEKSAFPNSVVEVATAVPAFIGYTAKAENGDKSLVKKPWRITSMAQYEQYYGAAPKPKFTIEDEPDLSLADFKIRATTSTEVDQGKKIAQENTSFILYYAIKLFFQNGGGPCYIVSVGSYDSPGPEGVGKAEIKAVELQAGVDTLLKEQEPTMVVIPEAVCLASITDCTSVQQAALLHCGGKMRNRVAILDVYDGYKDRLDPSGDCVANFRDALGINYLDFSAAYYPWVNSTIISDAEISFNYLSTDGKTTLIAMLEEELKVNITNDAPTEDDGNGNQVPTKDGQKLLDQRAVYKAELEKVIDFDVDFSATKALPDFADKTDQEIEFAVFAKRSLLNKTDRKSVV